MANKYWETETPVVMDTEKNEVRFFMEAGKVQVYPKVASAARGIGKGATIDLAAMEVDELNELQELIGKAIAQQLEMEPA